MTKQLTLFGEDAGHPEAKASGGKSREDYEAFVEKFRPKKTTDDCMTPPQVYDTVLAFVRRHWTETAGAPVVRPFWPGTDYREAAYPEGCVVVDNPPFSILSKIIRWYCAAGVRFFLFGPSLTLFTATDCDLTYVIANSDITYENGAVVRTGFVTNLPSPLRIWCCPELMEAIEAAQKTPSKAKRKQLFPDALVTAATLQRLTHRHVEFTVKKTDCAPVREISTGTGTLFGSGYLLSTRAAAERAAAERAAAERLTLGQKELAIIAGLDASEAKKAPASAAGAANKKRRD